MHISKANKKIVPALMRRHKEILTDTFSDWLSNRMVIPIRTCNSLLIQNNAGTRHNSADSVPTSNLVCITGLFVNVKPIFGSLTELY